MQSRGFDGTFRHLGSQPISRAAWLTFVAILCALAAFELIGQLVLPHA